MAALCWSSREEIPYVQGQGQKPRVPDCHGAGMAERSYPTFKVRGGGREELPTPEARGGDKRSYLEPWLHGHRRA